MSRIKPIIETLLIVCIVGCIVSLFFPSLHRLNIHSGSSFVSETSGGFEFSMSHVVLGLLILSFVCKNTFKWPLIGLITALCSIPALYLLRILIHYQEIMDRNFDTQTGFGFKLFFACTVSFVGMTLFQYIFTKRIKK